jgi:ribosomal protein L7Ae-like RNA K-turn-binding protein
MYQDTKVLSLIGLANKAGKIAVGRYATASMLHGHKAQLILFAHDAPEILVTKMLSRVKKNMTIAKSSIPKVQLGKILGREEVAVISISDFQFASAIIKLLPESCLIRIRLLNRKTDRPKTDSN